MKKPTLDEKIVMKVNQLISMADGVVFADPHGAATYASELQKDLGQEYPVLIRIINSRKANPSDVPDLQNLAKEYKR